MVMFSQERPATTPDRGSLAQLWSSRNEGEWHITFSTLYSVKYVGPRVITMATELL